MSARAASLVQPPPAPEPTPVRTAAPATPGEAQPRARPRTRPVQPPPVGPGLLQGRGVRITLRAALALVVAAVGAAAGWAVRANVTSTDPPPSRPARVVELGPASLRTPPGWAPERAELSRVPGLRPPVAVFAPTPGLDAHAVLTVAPIDDPSLVAAPIRDLLGPPGRPRERTLAGLPALSYPPRAVAGGRTAEVTVAKTSAGALTVLCIADSAAWVGAAGCADELAGASPGRAATLAPGPGAATPDTVAAAARRLGAARAGARAELSRATARREVQRLALKLARIHETAAASLRSVKSADPSLRGLVQTLGSGAGLYRRLARTAAAGRVARYRRTQAAIARMDAKLEQAARAAG